MRRVLAVLVAVLATAQAAQNRAVARDTPPKLEVTECVANTNSKYHVAGKMGRTARFTETVVVSDARPNRRVFLGFASNTGGAASHSFSSNCGKLSHVGIGVVTELVLDLSHLSRGRKLTALADADGVATFTVPVDACGKFFYQGFDWINNRNCQATPLMNLLWAPPPPAPVAVEEPAGPAGACGDDCSAGLFTMSYADFLSCVGSAGNCDVETYDIVNGVTEFNGFEWITYTAQFVDDYDYGGWDYGDYDGDGKGGRMLPEEPRCQAKFVGTNGDTLGSRFIVVNTQTPDGIHNICGSKAFAQ